METLQKYREEILHYLMTFMGGFMGLYAICAHGSYGSAQTGNLMDLLIDVSDGNGFSAAARIGAFLIFSSGIAAAWLLHEFCTLPMRELCIVVDAAALMLSARLPEEVFAFFRVYPIFFATSFQWGSFNHVGQYPSATLFLTGNLKNCVTRWLWQRWCSGRSAAPSRKQKNPLKPEKNGERDHEECVFEKFSLGRCNGCPSV